MRAFEVHQRYRHRLLREISAQRRVGAGAVAKVQVERDLCAQPLIQPGVLQIRGRGLRRRAKWLFGGVLREVREVTSVMANEQQAQTTQSRPSAV